MDGGVMATDRELAASIQQAYGLRVVGVYVLESSPVRFLAQVNDERGRTFGFKGRAPWIRENEFEVMLGLQEQAFMCGAPVPEVIRTTTGDLLWQWDGKDMALRAWVDGAPLRWRVDDALTLGSTVGAFFQATSAMEVPGVRQWTFPTGRSRWFPDTPHDLHAVTRFLQEVDLASSTVEAIDEILRFAASHAATDELPTGYLHGDVSPLNAIGDGGQTMWIDLDEMRWGYRIFDVAFGVATVAGLDQGPDGSIVRSTWELKRAEAFLSGWSRHTQPTEVEIRVFPWMLLLTLARVVIGELDLDDPSLATRPGVIASIEALLKLLLAPMPNMQSVLR